MSKPENGEVYMPVEERVEVFATGIGDIEPTGEYSLQQVVEASDRAQKAVEDPHVVCIDARHALERQPVREKVSGGNLNTFLYAAAAIDWPVFTDTAKAGGPGSMARQVADFLIKAGEKLGAHRGNCGAINKADPITEACGERAMDEPWLIQAKRHLGDAFNIAHWKASMSGYSRMNADEEWKKWDANEIQAVIDEKGGVVEDLDGSHTHPEKDPENKRHGHWEEGIRVNPEEGKSNDRDNAEILIFQVDVAPMVRMAKEGATTDEMFSLLLHAQVMRQYGTAYVLAKNQPVF